MRPVNKRQAEIDEVPSNIELMQKLEKIDLREVIYSRKYSTLGSLCPLSLKCNLQIMHVNIADSHPFALPPRDANR